MSALACAVLLAVVTVSLQKGVFDNLVKNLVSLYTGYIQVHAKGYWEEQTLDNSFEINDSLEQSVQKTAGVQQIANRLETFALASSGEKTRACLVVGIEPEAEDALTRLTPKIKSGAMLSNNRESALVADGLAEKLGLGLHDYKNSHRRSGAIRRAGSQ
jgi:ABC-type lipoprotein release transport system permease subunit